jgi:TPR repeat protein
MGKKGKKAQAGKPKKLTPKDVGKRLDVLVRKLEEELEGADLFAPLPPTEDCAICLVPVSRVNSGTCNRVLVYYQACCGKEICWACYKENEESINKLNEEKNAGKKEKKLIPWTCPFCREPNPTNALEYSRQLQTRCLQNDHDAFTFLGEHYRRGIGREMPKDNLKALDCWIRAVELGSPVACTQIGDFYDKGNGIGVAVNKERAALFERVGALRGDVVSRHNLGYSEYELGNHEIAICHWKIAAEAGHQKSLNRLKKIYNADGKEPGKEFISKDYLESTYRACHEAQMEVKSEEREKHMSEE